MYAKVDSDSPRLLAQKAMGKIPNLNVILSCDDVLMLYDKLEKKWQISPAGRRVLIRIMRRAIVAGRDFSGIMRVLQAEYDQVWQYQNESIRADPHQLGPIGEHNRIIFNEICNQIDIPSPEWQ